MSDVTHEWTVSEGEGRRRNYRLRWEHGVGTVVEASINCDVLSTHWSASYVVAADLARELANRSRLERIAEECINHLSVLHDDRPMLDALGIKIGDNLHDAIPKLIEMAKEGLERRKLPDAEPYALVVEPCPACNRKQLTILSWWYEADGKTVTARVDNRCPRCGKEWVYDE